MIDVSDLMNDPDFLTAYKVIRSKGKFVAGRFKIVEKKTLNYFHPVQPASTEDLEQLPEGDREKSIMKFFCVPPHELYLSYDQSEEHSGISDMIEYRNETYKIIKISSWGSNGFYRAFGVKVGG